MKSLGAVLLLFSFTAYGAMLSFSLVERVKKLERMLCYMSAVGEEIRLSCAELDTVLMNAPHKGEYIENGCWHGIESLKSREKEIAASFLTSLGRTDTEGQINNIRLHTAALENVLLEAREEKSRLSRLYVSLFFLCGLFAVVLIV